MFGWFRAACPLNVREKTWVELRLRWLVEQSEADRIRSLEVITPTKQFFPDPFSGKDHEVAKLFDRACAWMGVRRNDVDLKFFDRHIPSSHIAYGEASPLGLYVPRETEADRDTVWVENESLSDPLQFLGTVCHELAHCVLLGQGWLNVSVADHEFVTDLMPVIRGLGIFIAKTATIEKTFEYSDSSYRGVSKQGYLPARMLGYAMAVHAWMRGDCRPEWTRHLNADARRACVAGIRYLNSTHDCLCPRLVPDPSDHPLEGKGRASTGSPGGVVAGLWEFRKPGQAAPTDDEWSSIVSALGNRDPVVATEAAMTIVTLGRADPAVADMCLQRLRENHEHVELRAALAMVLGVQSPTDVVVDELKWMLEARASRVVKGALLALGRLGTTSDPDVRSRMLRVMKRALVDRDENLLLHAVVSLRSVSESPRKEVATFFAHDRELRQLALSALHMEYDDAQLITGFLPNRDSFPIPLPEWRPDTYHLDFLARDDDAMSTSTQNDSSDSDDRRR
jgi:hypothetical protein